MTSWSYLVWKFPVVSLWPHTLDLTIWLGGSFSKAILIFKLLALYSCWLIKALL